MSEKKLKKKLKKIPKFKNEKEEQKFWESHNSLDYFDFSNAKRFVFPNLRPSTKSISIRIPESMLSELKTLANKIDVPYQSYIKMVLFEKIAQEHSGKKAS